MKKCNCRYGGASQRFSCAALQGTVTRLKGGTRFVYGKRHVARNTPPGRKYRGKVQRGPRKFCGPNNSEQPDPWPAPGSKTGLFYIIGYVQAEWPRGGTRRSID